MLHGWQRLGCAILWMAWKDAHSTNGWREAREAGISPGVTLSGDARLFLESDGAAWLIALLELDCQIVDDLRAQLPPVLWEQLALSLEVP